MKTNALLGLGLVCLFAGTNSVQGYAAYSAAWSKTDCNNYSGHGLYERYVYGGDKGWINNNVWDSSSTEGVDCSAYVPRCLAIPGYIGEHTAGSHPYSTYSIYPSGLPHTHRVYWGSLSQWDLWVWNGHTGLANGIYSTKITTREAQCTACGVVAYTRYKSDLDSRATRYYRRNEWGQVTPKAPSALAAKTASWSQINLTWTDNANNETGFTIQKSTAGSGGPWSSAGSAGANAHSYSVTGLAANTKYWFHVRANNASGSSAWSGVASATTLDRYAPTAPASCTATATSDTQITVSWADSSNNEDKFTLQQSTTGTNWTTIKEVGANVTSAVVTGLTGNRKYYFHVRAANTAGASAWSPTGSDTTAPPAPSGLVARGGAVYSEIVLSWSDNSNCEVGFKVERSTDNVTFTQIGTSAAGIATYTSTGLNALTRYYYRVRAYNSNGNSGYSATANFTTPNAPPVLGAIGNKTVMVNNALAFSATATDPNKVVTTPWTATWEGNAHGDMEIMFRKPSNSGSTSAFINTAATNYTMVVTGAPSGVGGTKCLKANWSFKTGLTDYWVRFNTCDSPSWANPTVALDQVVKFRLYTTKALKVGIGLRETGTTAGYGANGGTTGTIDWAAVTNVLVGSKPIPNRYVSPSNWTTLTFNIPFEPQAALTGNGKVDQSGAKGVLEHIILRGEGGTGAYTVYLDDLSVVLQNTLTYTLDAGAPAGATIERKTGKFSWTPTTAGAYTMTVRVTDQLGAVDTETIKVTVTSTGNNQPTLLAIGNKTVNEGSTLSFTATASDPDAGQTLTYSLDAGYPSGATINPSSGAFSWTPTEAQGPGSYPITVRVTDNGTPANSNDWETITVTVNEINAAPVLATIANQTVNESQTFAYTAVATDSDLPTNAIAYSLVTAPIGMTINTNTGAITWTPTEADGPDTVQVTVRAIDNGNPARWTEQTFNLTVNELNSAPSLIMPTVYGHNVFAAIDELDDQGVEGRNNACLFRRPYFSSTTTNYLIESSYTYITNSFPQEEDVNVSYQCLYVNWTFKTGTTNAWLRLTTYSDPSWTNFHNYPNPTIDLEQHVRFKIWADKSVKLCLGVRETGVDAPIGYDGGITGPIEWVGATNVVGGAPQPTRVITASNWTTVDFNLRSEPIRAFTGNGALALGKGVLEHLAILPNAGLTSYRLYLDDFEVLTVKTTNSVAINPGETLQFILDATDPDGPDQDFTFSMSDAPTNAVLDGAEFLWTPQSDQANTTNAFTLAVTDSGTPALSNSMPFTIVVNDVNTRPVYIAQLDNVGIEMNSGTVTINVSATDYDDPPQALTYLLEQGPAGASIDPVTGVFTWTPPAVLSTNIVTIRVQDNGVPPQWNDRSFYIFVVPTNSTPVLSLGMARIDEPIANFESFTNNTPSGTVMFRTPATSATTSGFVDTAATNYSSVTTAFPGGNPRGSGAKVLVGGWSFRTGMTNYWVRLTTGGTSLLPNPTIDLNARIKFDIYATKSLKVGLGVRETGTTAENGADGGTTGSIEWLGVTNVVVTNPVPSRVVAASNWTTLEFDLRNEPIMAFPGSGDGMLNNQPKAVLEHLALVANGGTGAYTVYLDNFSVVTTSSLPATIGMKAGSTLTFTASATDPDPGSGLTFDLEGEFSEAHTNATLDSVTGAFSWTPGTADIGTTNDITVFVADNPTNGGVTKQDAKTLTVIVNSDPLGPQSTSVAADETVSLTWEAVPGKAYRVQSKLRLGDPAWTDLGEKIVVTGTVGTVTIQNTEQERFYRIIAVDEPVSDQ